MCRVQELVRMPGGSELAGFCLAVADDAGDDEIGIVESSIVLMASRTFAGCGATSKPSILAAPSSALSRVDRIFAAVVLPAPFEPSSAKILPRATSKSTPRNTCSSYDFSKPRTRIAWTCCCVIDRETTALPRLNGSQTHAARAASRAWRASGFRCVYRFSIFQSLCPVTSATCSIVNPASKSRLVPSCRKSWK